MNSSNALLNKDVIKIALIRPPLYLWPIINESDNFLLPLGLPSLAAYLRREVPGVDIEIIDCCPMRYGWKKLTSIIREMKPDLVGVGDLVCYMHEGMKAVKIAKELNPGVVTVAGGHFHSFMTEYSLSNYPALDYIIRWEGEVAFAELIRTLRSGGDLSKVPSLAYRDNGRIAHTAPAPVIMDLDTLPIPAYDLTPLERYSPFGVLWPKAATIQGNRGCIYNCRFCSWSNMESDHFISAQGELTARTTFRTKSVGRILDEIDLLYNKWNIRYLFWVEGTWNMDNQIMDELSSEIIRRGYKLGWWAFVRPDKLLEQEKLGILPKMVKAGFSHTLMGGERTEESDFNLIGKTGASFEIMRECCHLLERKYPTVFRQATFVTGIPTDTEESMINLGRDTRMLHLDFAAYHPIMPFPGTDMWEKYKDSPLMESTDFSKYDMFQPVLRTPSLTREQVAALTKRITLEFVNKQPLRYVKGMFSRIRIRRRLHRWFLFSMIRVVLLDLWRSIQGKQTFTGFAATSRLWKPTWYDS